MQLNGISLNDIDAAIRIKSRNKLRYFFPETGDFRRALYPKHLEFLRATKDYSEVAFIAGNRTGKSETAVFAGTLWLTGRYPEWWEGRVFKRETIGLVAGETSKLVRDSIQAKFCGPPNAIGTGMIPCDDIIERKAKPGMPDAIDTVRIRHQNGNVSTLRFGSYDQGREAFQATEYDFVIFDEEPPLSVYTEGMIRTMTRNGIVVLAFTPIRGCSEVVIQFQDAMRDAKA